MKWLEIIELRSVGKKRTEVELHLKHLIEAMKLETRQQAIKIYGHNTVETDFSIHLHHDSKSAAVNGSALGQRLVSVLKEYGLVSHSVWIEK